MSLIFAILLHGLAPAPPEVRAFQDTEPGLTYERAEEHLAAARLAGVVYGVRPELLLSVAWHESRYTNAITREPGHRVSCGPMTPIPHRGRCTADELSTVGGYLRGTEHLRSWMDHPRCRGSERCGITSYAGGGGLVRACARTGRSINAFHRNACRVAPDVLGKARQIRRALGARS